MCPASSDIRETGGRCETLDPYPPPDLLVARLRSGASDVFILALES
jgi:hypothetical protein